MEPFLQFVIREENVASPETSDVSGSCFEAHILDGCTDGLDISQFHHVLVRRVGLTIVHALGIHYEYNDRCLFQDACCIDGRRNEFVISLAENGSLIAFTVAHDALLQALHHSFSFFTTDDDELPWLFILF